MSSFSDLVQAADRACEEGRFADAISKAVAALETRPGNENALLILADAYANSGQPGKAAEAIGEVLRRGSDRRDLIYTQAVLLRGAGRRQEALTLAERNAKDQQHSDEAQAFLGVLLMELGRQTSALDSFKRAIELNPKHAPHQFNLALAQIQVGRISEALQVLGELTTRFPEFAPAHICLSELLLKQGKSEGALEAAHNALLAQPDSAKAHILIAKALNDGADTGSIEPAEQRAERHIRMALTLGDNSHETHALLGFALQQWGRFEDARVEFEKSIRLNPLQGAVYYGLATCSKFATNDHAFPDQLEKLLEAGRLPPLEQAQTHYALGKVLEDQGAFAEALEQFDRANALMFELRTSSQPFDSWQSSNLVSQTIETFDAAFIERQRGLGCPSELPLFVVGMMRSGTTLVEQILSSHPQIAGAGELSFWPEAAGHLAFDHAGGIDRQQVLLLSESYLNLLSGIDSSAARIIDKMPRNTMNLGLIQTVFPEAKIIHCRRHPVDTCLSIFTTPYGESPSFAHDRRNIVTAYRQYLRLMDHWRTVIPADRLLEVDYEELVGDREGVTRRMIEFVGLAWDDACLKHEYNRRTVKTPSRWQVRQPIYATSTARWKNYEPWLNEFAELLSPSS